MMWWQIALGVLGVVGFLFVLGANVNKGKYVVIQKGNSFYVGYWDFFYWCRIEGFNNPDDAVASARKEIKAYKLQHARPLIIWRGDKEN